MPGTDSNAVLKKVGSRAVPRRPSGYALAGKQEAESIAKKPARTAETPAALLGAAQPPVTPLEEMEGDPNFMTSLARGLAERGTRD